MKRYEKLQELKTTRDKLQKFEKLFLELRDIQGDIKECAEEIGGLNVCASKRLTSCEFLVFKTYQDIEFDADMFERVIKQTDEEINELEGGK